VPSRPPTVTPHRDPYRDIDAQATPAQFIASLEARGRTPAQARLRRRFLKFAGVTRGAHVLEVGCGTGVVLRDLAALAGPTGSVTGVDMSRTLVAAARKLCGKVAGRAPISIRAGDGASLPFSGGKFDAVVAVTVVLHVADPLALVREMARVARPGGIVGLQDQDFGTVAVTHPDPELTDRIMRGVAAHIYEEPYSGRRLPGLLRAAGLDGIRLLTDVYQDTEMVPYTKAFLERRAENAVRFRLVDEATAERWLDGFNRVVAHGSFVMTMNYYGAVGTKSEATPRAARR
jgi:ubiquinone/menaquinone biosynthesis C-methylase UbiE